MRYLIQGDSLDEGLDVFTHKGVDVLADIPAQCFVIEGTVRGVDGGVEAVDIGGVFCALCQDVEEQCLDCRISSASVAMA